MYRARPQLLKQLVAKRVQDHVDSFRVMAAVLPHASGFVAAFAQRNAMGRNGVLSGLIDNLIRIDPVFDYKSRSSRWRTRYRDRLHLRCFVQSDLFWGDAVDSFFFDLLRYGRCAVKGMLAENPSQCLR